jgi:co-chaperonin GroES (HSP10)
MYYVALGDKIVAKKVKAETQTTLGIQLPQNTKKRFNRAIAIDISPKFETELKIGDTFCYHTTLHEYDDDIIILREDHIDYIVREGERPASKI